jgi:putative component of membrane protein insertase Oxa1/YidC/SpoIIIJ protein YidD
LKEIFKIIIRLYWLIVPHKLKGICLFGESCSKHVFRILENQGTKAGLKALFYRFKVCRTPFLIRKNKENNQYEVHLCNGDVVKEELINPYHLKKNKVNSK